MKKQVWVILFLIAIGSLLLNAESPVLLLFPVESPLPSSETGHRILGALEKGFLKSGRYRLLNYDKLELLLKAQGFLLSGFFDESRVVTIGKMIPAEFAAATDVNIQDGRYTIQVRLFDLESGETKAVESLTRVQEQELEAGLIRLAFRLSGIPLPVEAGGALSLTVTANRDDAVVFIDGVEQGRTPFYLEGLPPGNYFLEVKKGSLYYSEFLVLEKNSRIAAPLAERYGSLIIHSEPDGAEVTVGDTQYGITGFIEKLPALTQKVLLRKKGFFWSGMVPVIQDRVIKIDVALEKTARITIKAPPEALSSFYLDSFIKEFSGEIVLEDILPGNYTLETRQKGFRLLRETITVKAGDMLIIEPELLLTEEKSKRMDELFLYRIELEEEIAGLSLHEIYFTQEIPAMNTRVLKNTLLSLVPGLDILILFDSPLLPVKDKKHFKGLALLQFGTGLLLQAGLAGYFLAEEESWKNGFLIGSAAAGAIELGLGIYGSAVWGKWTKEQEVQKERYLNLRNKLEETGKELGQ